MTTTVAVPVADAGVGAAAPRRRPLQEVGFWLVLAGLLLSCFAGHWKDLGVPVPLDRFLLGAGLLLEWDRARVERRLPILTAAGVLLIAAAAWAALSFAGSPVRTADGFWFLLDLYVVPTVLFVCAPLLFGTRRRRFALAASFAVFGLYLGFTAITQTLHLSALVFPSYILDPSIGLHQDRARGPYVEAVDNGLMLVISGAFAVFLAHTASSRRWRMVGAVAALLCVVGSALTLTRAIWIATAAGLVIAIAVVPGLRRRLPLVLVALVALGGLFLAAFPDFLVAATARGESQLPIYDRLNVAQGARAMTFQYPLFGVGWNQAGIRMIEFVRLGQDYPVTASSAGLIPHNIFLGRFAELGIPGAALWLASLVAALVLPVLHRCRSALQPWRPVLLACTVCWLIAANFGPVNYSEPQYLLFLLGGIVAAGRAEPPPAWDWRPAASRPARRLHRASRGSADLVRTGGAADRVDAERTTQEEQAAWR